MGVAVHEATLAPRSEPVAASEHRGARYAVNCAAVVIFAATAVAALWFIHHFSVNMIYYDQFADINVIMHAHDGTLSLATLWDQHNENRIFFPNLVVLLLAYTTHFNVVVEDLLSGVSLIATTGLIIAAHRRRSPSIPWIFYCPVALVLLSLAPLGTTMFGFLLSWYLVLLGLGLTLFVLDRQVLTWLAFGGAAAAAIVGSFSSLQGLFIWPAGLVLLYLRRRSRSHLLAWVGIAVITAIVYFLNFNFAATGGDETGVLKHPVTLLRFFFSSLGNVVGAPIADTANGGNTGALVLGIVMFAVAIVALVHGFRRDRSDGTAIGIALICFGLLFDAFITLGRSQLGLVNESRFAIFMLFVWIGCYLALLEPVSLPMKAKVSEWMEGFDHRLGVRSRSGGAPRHPVPWRQAVTLLVLGLLGVLFVMQVGLATRNGINNAKSWYYEQSQVADVTANIGSSSDAFIQSTLGNYPAAFLRQMIAFARSQHLSLFDTPIAATDARSGLNPVLVIRLVLPADGARVSGRAAPLDATVANTRQLKRVEFRVRGSSLHGTITIPGRLLPYGWFALWDTGSVARGSYQVWAVASYAGGHQLAGAVSTVFVHY
jgi:hypothetical protein